ncbi:hypothetical protein ACFFX0_27075 [Citricoccus parietis]|uniref:PASTA domain-containing protein n=1 Tax=Citricoccus parietis TaxID=592307 RepID=A0ABV5G6T1_9MICC
MVVLALIAVLAVHLTHPSRPVADGYKGHPASPTPTTSSPATPTPGSVAAAPSGSVAPTGVDDGSHPTWDPAAGEPAGAGQEPKVPNGEGTEPYRLPSTSPREPALTEVPAAAVGDHELVAGFPDHVVPVPDGSEVQSSSVSPQGQRVVVGLHVLSDDDPQELLDFYARRCEDLGWPVTRTPAPDGAPRMQCGFGPDSLTVTAPTLPTGRVGLSASGAFVVDAG